MTFAVEPGLCGDCRRAQPIRADRGAVYWRCARSKTDPAYPKYPRLPVLHCPGWEPDRRDGAPTTGDPGPPAGSSAATND